MGPAADVPVRGGGAPAAPPRSAREMLERARDFLAAKGVEEARLEAELLVAHALGLDRLGLFLALERPLQEQEIVRGRELLVRRAKGAPVAYLTGVREFYGRPFRVGPGCLVPRPETEHLVDAARQWAGERTRRTVRDLERARDATEGRAASSPDWAPDVLDLGTGSGCLAVTLALELEGARVSAVDRSEKALEWARTNAELLGARVELHAGDALAHLDRLPGRSLDLIVSNPPYVRREKASELAREVRDHEPEVALFAPEGDPDYWVRELLRRAPSRLRPGGLLLVELGHDQGPRALELSEAGGETAGRGTLIADLAGIDRVLAVRIPA